MKNISELTTVEFLWLVWPLGVFFIALCAILFSITNLIRIIVILELILLSNVLFLIIGAKVLAPEYFVNLISIFPIFLSAAAAEAVVGLAILVVLYRHKNSIDKNSIDNQIKG